MEVGPVCSGTLYECNQRAVMTKRGQKVVIDENGKREVTTLADSAELQKLIKPNDWNEYVVIARGPEIILKINGVVMTHMIDREKGKAAGRGPDYAATPSRPAHESAIQEPPHQVSEPIIIGDRLVNTKRLDRRDFLRTSAATAAAISLPYLLPAGVFGQPGPNER